MRDYQSYVLETDVMRDCFFYGFQPFDSLLQTRCFDQRLRIGRNPLGIEFDLASFDQARNRADDGRRLTRADAGYFFEAAPLIQKHERLLSWSRFFGRRMPGPRAFAEVSQSLQNFRAVDVCFLFTYAWDLFQLGKTAGTTATQLFERAVVKNDVSGHFIFSRHVAPPLSQKLCEQRIGLCRRRLLLSSLFRL